MTTAKKPRTKTVKKPVIIEEIKKPEVKTESHPDEKEFKAIV